MTVIFGTQGEDGRRLAHALLQQSVRLFWGWRQCPELARTPRGKPFFPSVHGRWFSLSHSGGYAVCALSEDGPVGVDIELVRPHRETLPSHVLTPQELEGFDGSWDDFTRLWTRKESWCKREDQPIYPPKKVSLPEAGCCRSIRGDLWWVSTCAHGEISEEIRWIPLGQDP